MIYRTKQWNEATLADNWKAWSRANSFYSNVKNLYMDQFPCEGYVLSIYILMSRCQRPIKQKLRKIFYKDQQDLSLIQVANCGY